MKEDPLRKIWDAMSNSLVEILIVIAIIGLLAAIAVPSFYKARESARAGQAGPQGKDYVLWCKVNPSVNLTFEEWQRAKNKGMVK